MIKIKFIKSFSSPVYGNVYAGKELAVKKAEAEKQVSFGNAVIVEKQKEIKPVEKVNEDGADKPKRSKRAFKSRSK